MGRIIIAKTRELTQEEKEKSLRQAVAIVEMEGHTFTEEDKRIVMDMFDGKISKEDLIKRIHQRLLNEKQGDCPSGK